MPWASPGPGAHELMGTAGHLDTHLPGTRAALREGILSLGKARIITPLPPPCSMRPKPALPRTRSWTGWPG